MQEQSGNCDDPVVAQTAAISLSQAAPLSALALQYSRHEAPKLSEFHPVHVFTAMPATSLQPTCEDGNTAVQISVKKLGGGATPPQ
jgi:hypothetical protein